MESNIVRRFIQEFAQSYFDREVAELKERAIRLGLSVPNFLCNTIGGALSMVQSSTTGSFKSSKGPVSNGLRMSLDNSKELKRFSKAVDRLMDNVRIFGNFLADFLSYYYRLDDFRVCCISPNLPPDIQLIMSTKDNPYLSRDILTGFCIDRLLQGRQRTGSLAALLFSHTENDALVLASHRRRLRDKLSLKSLAIQIPTSTESAAEAHQTEQKPTKTEEDSLFRGDESQVLFTNAIGVSPGLQAPVTASKDLNQTTDYVDLENFLQELNEISMVQPSTPLPVKKFSIEVGSNESKSGTSGSRSSKLSVSNNSSGSALSDGPLIPLDQKVVMCSTVSNQIKALNNRLGDLAQIGETLMCFGDASMLDARLTSSMRPDGHDLRNGLRMSIKVDGVDKDANHETSVTLNADQNASQTLIQNRTIVDLFRGIARPLEEHRGTSMRKGSLSQPGATVAGTSELSRSAEEIITEQEVFKQSIKLFKTMSSAPTPLAKTLVLHRTLMTAIMEFREACESQSDLWMVKLTQETLLAILVYIIVRSNSINTLLVDYQTIKVCFPLDTYFLTSRLVVMLKSAIKSLSKMGALLQKEELEQSRNN